MNGFLVEVEKNQVICREGEASSDLFYINSGRILACTVQGTEVKVFSRIGPGEFIGELAFFDGQKRASYIVALEKSQLIRIPKEDIHPLLPIWFIQVGKNLTKKIRHLDHILHNSKIRKSQSQNLKPLTMEEQREIYRAITHQDT